MNHPEVNLIESDIRLTDPATIIQRFPEAFGVDLLVLCAPCQPFSSQNRKRGVDNRAELLLEAPRFVQALQPGCVLIENVPGLTTPSNVHIVDQLKAQLREVGYRLSEPRRIDAADLGVPQRRLRCVMLACRSESALRIFEQFEFPVIRKTVRDFIGDLPAVTAGRSLTKDALHRPRVHQQIALDRLRAIPKDGGSRSSLPTNLRLKCHTDDHSYSDVYGRMRWDDVAPTLTTGCDDVTRGRFAHPDQDRAITLREAARLQTFPKKYRFAGNKSEIARQIGNAVPVEMVKAIIPVIRQILRSIEKERQAPPAVPTAEIVAQAEGQSIGAPTKSASLERASF